MLTHEQVAAINQGLQRSHSPVDAVKYLSISPLTIPLRLSYDSEVDIRYWDAHPRASSAAVNIVYTNLDVPILVRVYADVTGNRLSQLSAGLVYLESTPVLRMGGRRRPQENETLASTLLDQLPEDRPYSLSDFSSLERLAALYSEDPWEQVGACIGLYGHLVSYRAAALRVTTVASRYPELAYEGELMSTSTDSGVRGSAALFRYQQWAITIDYVQLETQYGQHKYFGKGAAHVVSQLNDHQLHILQKLKSSPASLEWQTLGRNVESAVAEKYKTAVEVDTTLKAMMDRHLQGIITDILQRAGHKP